MNQIYWKIINNNQNGLFNKKYMKMFEIKSKFSKPDRKTLQLHYTTTNLTSTKPDNFQVFSQSDSGCGPTHSIHHTSQFAWQCVHFRTNVLSCFYGTPSRTQNGTFRMKIPEIRHHRSTMARNWCPPVWYTKFRIWCIQNWALYVAPVSAARWETVLVVAAAVDVVDRIWTHKQVWLDCLFVCEFGF